MPPTDPRILAMTDEQIDLEYELILLDKARKDGSSESFEDNTFEDWDDETEGVDRRLSDPYNPTPATEQILPKPSTTTEYIEEDWEVIE